MRKPGHVVAFDDLAFERSQLDVTFPTVAERQVG